MPLAAGLWVVFVSVRLNEPNLKLGVFSLGVAVIGLALVNMYNYDGTKRMKRIEDKLDLVLERTIEVHHQSLLYRFLSWLARFP